MAAMTTRLRRGLLVLACAALPVLVGGCTPAPGGPLLSAGGPPSDVTTGPVPATPGLTGTGGGSPGPASSGLPSGHPGVGRPGSVGPSASLPPSARSFPADRATSCAGHPPAADVIAAVRAAGQVGDSVTPSVRTGPMCAGTWQYTVLTLPGREPLQVVTRTGTSGLVLVTAGTDVCGTLVTALAPAGIRILASCTRL